MHTPLKYWPVSISMRTWYLSQASLCISPEPSLLQCHKYGLKIRDASLTADPGVASSIPARSHTFMEIDHEIISTVIFLPSAKSFKKGCYQLQAKVCAQSTG